MTDTIDKAISIIMDDFKKSNGADAILEKDEHLCGVFNDGIIIIEKKSDTLKINVIAGKPLIVDLDLDLLEEETVDE